MDYKTLQTETVQNAMQDVLEQFGLLVRYMDLNYHDDVLEACETMHESVDNLALAVHGVVNRIEPITESTDNV